MFGVKSRLKLWVPVARHVPLQVGENLNTGKIYFHILMILGDSYSIEANIVSSHQMALIYIDLQTTQTDL